ncbi:hypothetical protein U1Q18_005940 [Sarracenia purpurea var. burkii]
MMERQWWQRVVAKGALAMVCAVAVRVWDDGVVRVCEGSDNGGEGGGNASACMVVRVFDGCAMRACKGGGDARGEGGNDLGACNGGEVVVRVWDKWCCEGLGKRIGFGVEKGNGKQNGSGPYCALVVKGVILLSGAGGVRDGSAGACSGVRVWMVIRTLKSTLYAFLFLNKGSSDKRGWSFRKRSAGHRVLSNTVISETPSSLDKESPETANVNIQTQSNTTFSEKTSAVARIDERPLLSTIANLEVPDIIVGTEDDKMHDINTDESVIVVIQTAVRGFLAQREMLKLKYAVKLQAAVRGHLVRRQAVGTLRCVQAIVKVQALVRARRARLSSQGSCVEEKLAEDHAKDDHSSKEKGNSGAKPNVMYISIEKLLSNKFARQLLESTPRTKRICIKCDPSRTDSAWNWLERWMSVSSMGAEQALKSESVMEQQEGCESVGLKANIKETKQQESCESVDLKANIKETIVPCDSKEGLLTYDADNFDIQARQPTLSSKSDNLEPLQPENSGMLKSKESSVDLFSHQTKQLDSISQMELKSVTSMTEMETGEKNCVFETIKLTNPSFIAVQSKFEELSSTANQARSTSSHNKVSGVESNPDFVSSGMDNAIKTREIDLAENSALLVLRDSKVGGSESGTVLSISSTLDSPARSEIGGIDVELEAELPEDEGAINPETAKNLDFEANGETTIEVSNLSYSTSMAPEKPDNVNGAKGESVISVTSVDSLQEKQRSEISESNVPSELHMVTGHETHKSSPEASPRSHMTIAESQGTPSSQVSVKVKRTKRDRAASNQKHRSPSIPKQDSSGRSSLEQLPEEQKSGKRRNSFGSGRPDYVDQEPRDSNGSNSLPSYMQATESARAKALANSSPRSSPDVQDKDIYVKKRHSLPGANGRQGSPRIQKSLSRTQHGEKGNGHLHERKWQR